MLKDSQPGEIYADATSCASVHDARRRNLKRLLAPRHVAMVGGLGNIPAIEMLRASGFQGAIWPVHPTRTKIAGLPVFRSIDDLPQGPDAAFLNVPAQASIQIVRDLARRRGGGAICYSAGFSELGEEGLSTQRKLVEAAGELAVLGPNANGLLNCLDGLALWPVPSHRPARMTKGVAVLSSSGGVLFNYPSSQRSVPAAIMAAVGNQALIGFPDLIDILVDDPRIEAIGLFAEYIGDPVAFSRAAERAAARGLPIVVLKTGKSSSSAALAATHSGAMIAADDMVDALFQRCGVIRVHSLPEFDETLKMLTVSARPKGRKTVAMTISGGEKALILDTADGLALEFTDPPPQISKDLERQIPEYASVSNPFDFNPYYSGSDVLAMDNRPALEKCFKTVFSAGYDIAMMLVSIRTDEAGATAHRGDLYTATLEAYTAACQDMGVSGTVVSVMPEHLPYHWRERLSRDGIAPLMGLGDALKAIDNTLRWAEQATAGGAAGCGLPDDIVVIGNTGLLSENEAKAALVKLGLVVPRSCVAHDEAEAADKADEIGYPVVLKVLEPVIAHKAKAGGVALGISSRADMIAACAAMKAGLAEAGHTPTKFLVEAMICDTRSELILGIKYEPGFGHALLLGHGGVEVESGDRPAMVLLPQSEQALERFVFDADAVRGLSADTKAQVLNAVRSVVSYWERNRDGLTGLDINPLIVDSTGQVTAVDALIEQSEPENA